VSGLRVQIDAAINPGNSAARAGGDKVIGLAFSHLANAQNRVHHPCEEIDLFLKDIADGHYDGKPALYDELQTLENPPARVSQGRKSVQVSLCTSLQRRSVLSLKVWDIITKIGDTAVDDQE